MGVPNYAVPYLAPNSTGKAILYGVNYASGGGGIMNATGRIFVSFLSRFLPLLTLSISTQTKCLWNLKLNLFWLGLDIQIDFFNNTRKQFDKLLGSSKAKDYISKRSIFSITIGANDFLNNYLLPVLSIGARISESPDGFIDDMINQLRNQLTVCR